MANINELSGAALQDEARRILKVFAVTHPAYRENRTSETWGRLNKVINENTELTADRIKMLCKGNRLAPDDKLTIEKYGVEKGLIQESEAVNLIAHKAALAEKEVLSAAENIAQTVEQAAKTAKPKSWKNLFGLLDAEIKIPNSFKKKPAVADTPVAPAAEHLHAAYMPKAEVLSPPDSFWHLPSIESLNNENIGIAKKEIIKEANQKAKNGLLEMENRTAIALGEEPPHPIVRVTAPAPIPPEHAAFVPAGTPVVEEAPSATEIVEGESEKAIESSAPAAEVKEAEAALVKEKSWFEKKLESAKKFFKKDAPAEGAGEKLGRNAKKEVSAVEKIVESGGGSGRKWALGLTVAAAAGAWAAYAHEGKKQREAEARIAGRQ